MPYIEGGPCRPGGATAPPPVARCGGDPPTTESPRCAAQGPICKFFLQKRPVAPCLGDRGPIALPIGDMPHFGNSLERPYIFEILIFF